MACIFTCSLPFTANFLVGHSLQWNVNHKTLCNACMDASECIEPIQLITCHTNMEHAGVSDNVVAGSIQLACTYWASSGGSALCYSFHQCNMVVLAHSRSSRTVQAFPDKVHSILWTCQKAGAGSCKRCWTLFCTGTEQTLTCGSVTFGEPVHEVWGKCNGPLRLHTKYKLAKSHTPKRNH